MATHSKEELAEIKKQREALFIINNLDVIRPAEAQQFTKLDINHV